MRKKESECGKIRTRITPNMDTFYAVEVVIERFTRVIEFIKSYNFECRRACAMKIMAKILCEDSIDLKERAHLKERLQKVFPDELLFLNMMYDSPQLIMHKPCMRSNTKLT